MLLPPANEVWGKVMFYTCLSFCSQEGSLSGGVFVRGSLSRESLSGGLCPMGVSLSNVSLSNGGVSVWGVSVREIPCTVKRGRYASYWNAFLLEVLFHKK